jgi:ATP-dependent Clp protease adaptor protein ClpS
VATKRRREAKETPETQVLERTRAKLQRPPRFRVLLHDDDFTTQEFVVELLESLFNQPPEEAVRIMLDVHHKGIGLAGIFAHEVAEAKAAETIRRARAQEFPFLATLEPEQEDP